jgi:hypothetical protein
MRPIAITVDTELKPTNIVRRYLDLPKFLDMLRTSSMYFRRADGFPDRFEGALTPAFRKAIDDHHRSGKLKHDAEYFYRRARVGNFVSCWSLGAKDNMALWQLYSGVTTSVAVTTTIERLIQVAVAWNEPTLLHKVQYIDHSKSPDMVIGRYTDVLCFKNEAYEYEKEIRIIVPRQSKNWERNPDGVRLPVRDLDILLRSVVVSPEAQPWFVELIQDVCGKYGVSAPVRRSKLAFLPK